jgi:hypothetical protein
MIQVEMLQCSRCEHKWQRRHRRLPKVCPKCKRTDWNSVQEFEAKRSKRKTMKIFKLMEKSDPSPFATNVTEQVNQRLKTEDDGGAL